MKKIFLTILFSIITIFVFNSCYMLGKYVYSDKELDEHYRDKRIKPEFRNSFFLGRKVHYAVMSKNDTLPLLVMIHGAPGAWYGYLNLTDDSLLQQNFKIVAVDRLGYGKSGYGKEELSVRRQAMAISRIIEKENTAGKKVYLLGRSYGAPIAAYLAIHEPEKFKKLVMVSPVIDPEKEKFYWFSGLGRSPLVQWALPEQLNVATKEKFSHQKEMRLMLPEWEKLNTPTCVITGEDDTVADTANYSFAKKHLLNCPAVFLKLRNTGHQITKQRPVLIRELLLEQPYDELASIISDEQLRGGFLASGSGKQQTAEKQSDNGGGANPGTDKTYFESSVIGNQQRELN